MSKKIVPSNGAHKSPFEQIRHVNEAGVDYWESRDLAEALGYTQYRNFESVIERARLACFNSGFWATSPYGPDSKVMCSLRTL